MERIKKNIKGLVKEFTADDVEMLDTTGTVLQFKDDVPSSTVKWICHLIEKPSMCFRNLYYVHFSFYVFLTSSDKDVYTIYTLATDNPIILKISIGTNNRPWSSV